MADIFRRNALKNGVAPVVIDEASHAALAASVGGVIVDIERMVVSWSGGEATFEIEPFARHCLMEGVDELGYLLGQADAIGAYESARPRYS
jgi:3-isopropylmalate/(R)-2-methylmalate dehydratase small subunit